MYKQAEGFQPVPDDTILWRYQDITRYIDLLLKRQLFFSRADKFEDPYEGNFAAPESIQKKFVTVNSWHANTTENYAMWKIYATGDYGLAIQTNFQRLKDSFRNTEKEILIGNVQYYHDESQCDSANNLLVPFVRKRKIYEYENEVRCVYVINGDEKNIQWEEQDKYEGIFVDVDIDVLIERIYISPYSPKWIRDIVAGINEKFEVKKEIVHSRVFEWEGM